MSGGVDSSLAAYLLKKKGFEIIGIFMKNWSETLQLKKNGLVLETNLCPWVKDQEDMRRVCTQLKIPFYTFDFEREYKKRVVDYFFNAYQQGITPNPDIMCNKEIKFNLFLEKSLKLGANFIATGHHVRKKRKKIAGKESFRLLKGKDPEKDQSYFLYSLTQNQLRYTIFPIGEYRKQKVRLIAKDLKLTTHAKKDSQGICFIGEVDLERFLKQRIKEKPGKIITADGKIIGQHQGLPFYTIGQRKGIKIGGGIPYYVAAKDVRTNTLIVVKGSQDPNLYRKELLATNLNWISKTPNFPLKCKAKIRYRQPDQEVKVESIKRDRVMVKFYEPQRAITPGQSVVFYYQEELLGGGTIE